MTPQKERSLNRVPPQKVADQAQKGLELHKKFKRGGTKIGFARARDLKNRRRLSPQTLQRMVSYFARHSVDRKADGFGDDKNPSNGYIAWLLWGGDPGKEWAESLCQTLEKYDD